MRVKLQREECGPETQFSGFALECVTRSLFDFSLIYTFANMLN